MRRRKSGWPLNRSGRLWPDCAGVAADETEGCREPAIAVQSRECSGKGSTLRPSTSPAAYERAHPLTGRQLASASGQGEPLELLGCTRANPCDQTAVGCAVA